MTTKEEIIDSIANLLGVSPPKISTGSTESREIFDLVDVTLGLGLGSSLTKPELARAIVERLASVGMLITTREGEPSLAMAYSLSTGRPHTSSRSNNSSACPHTFAARTPSGEVDASRTALTIDVLLRCASRYLHRASHALEGCATRRLRLHRYRVAYKCQTQIDRRS